MVLGVVFGGILQILYVYANRNKILKLFELIDLNFEYASQTGLQEIDMEGYNRKMMLVIYWWGSVIVMALVFVLAGPLAIKNQRFAYPIKILELSKTFDSFTQNRLID